MKRYVKPLGLTSAVAAAALLAACGGGGSSGQASGTLGVAMTDAPACGFDAVNVTVKKVRVHQSASAGDSDAGWTDITLNPARKINLLNLTNGALEELGQTPLAAGHYTQLRLVLDANAGAGLANSVVPTGSGTEVALDTPSAVQSGIKLNHEFDVAAEQRVDLVLDFDACKSIVKKGKSGGYGLKPVVNVIPTAVNGISGTIDPAVSNANVMVTAQQNGTVVRSTVPNANGEFFLARLAPGNYDVVITADNRAATVIATVPVVSTTGTVPVSSAAAPISLAPAATPPRAISGTVILNPPSDTEVAYVAARQSFSAGPTVTVKYQGADVETGAYTLSNLPTVAASFARYTATLPLVFTAPTNTTPGTGKYKVEASANGYASQSVPAVDITTAAQLGVNLTLAP